MFVLPLFAGAASVSPGTGERSPPLQLELPLACDFGKNCFIQQYVDHDAGPGVKDYRCGTRSYDGHKGTDFRLSTLAAQRRGIAVLAAAGGSVRAIRNDMDDRLLENGDASSVKGRECGNGVLIEAPGGWETQYCHLAKGSVLVMPGQTVRTGEKIGLVGLSGDTEFPHLHLSIRHEGRIVDPFAPAPTGTICGVGGGRSLWSQDASHMLSYRTSEIINTGFADGPVTAERIEDETLRVPVIRSPALVYYARLIGVREGDVLRLAIGAPDGSAFAAKDLMVDRDQAIRWAYIGKRVKSGLLPGNYTATAMLIRGGSTVALRRDVLELR